LNYSGVGPFDIGLLRLKRPLQFSQYIQPIALPQGESEPSGNSFLAGWGSISRSRYPEYPDKLQHAQLPLIDRAVCHEAVKRLTGSSPVHETNVCTGPLNGDMSACSVSKANFKSL